MKRPLAFFGFTLFGVLLCLNLSDSTVFSVSILIGASVLFVISIIIKRLRQPLILPTVLSAVIVSCLLFLCLENSYNNTLDFCGENISVEGEVAESPYFSEENRRYYCVIKVKSINSKRVSTKMRLSFSESNDGIDHDDFEIGDKVSFYSTVYPMGSYNNTYKSYYKSQKIYLGAYSVEGLEITESKYRPIGYYIDALRDKITENFLHDFNNDVASLLIAVLTGDKSFMKDSIYDDFKESGVVHIMAVSGLHLSIWVTFLALFIDFSGRKGKIMAALMIVFTVFMMNFAYFTGSVKRAAMMTILFFIGKILGKNSDSLNSLGFAAVCALGINPFAVADISFMLSFLSTLGIIVLGLPLSDRMMKLFGKVGEKLRKAVKPFVLCFAISISVSIFTLPVSLYYFGGFSLVAAATNLLFLFAVTPLVLLTGLYTFLRFVPFVSVAVAVIIKYLALYMLNVAEYLSSFKFSYIHTDFEQLKYWLAVVFILVVLTMIFYNYSRVLTRVTAILSVGLFVLSLGFNYYISLDKCKITVFGARGGNCAVVSLNGHGVLIGFEGDSYSEEVLTEEAETLNTEIDTAVFLSESLTQNQKSVSHSLSIDNILTSEGTSVTLFDKVTVTRGETYVIVETADIKTDIFYKDPLQEGDSYGIIKNNDIPAYGEYEKSVDFSVGEESPFTVIVRSNNIEVRGEGSWLNLMKKVLKVT